MQAYNSSMMDEHWATFSIYYHWTALYRRALLLFDRVVVPIPTEPYAKVSAAEIDMLAADVAFLERSGAAVRFDWDPAKFHEWQRSVSSEALARTLNQDPLYATRLHLAQEYAPLVPPGVDSVTAVPVYRDQTAREVSDQELASETQETVLLEIVLPRLPVPADDVPLEAILALREKDQFREALYAVRKWQAKVVPELLSDRTNRDRRLRAAAADFERWVKQYSEAITDANFAKTKTAVTSVLAVGAILVPFTTPVVAALSALASPLFALRELKKRSWKVVAAAECAPAAVVYASSQLA